MPSSGVMKLRRYGIFWGVLYKEGGKGGCQNMGQTLNNERGYWDHPQTQKAQRDSFGLISVLLYWQFQNRSFIKFQLFVQFFFCFVMN